MIVDQIGWLFRLRQTSAQSEDNGAPLTPSRWSKLSSRSGAVVANLTVDDDDLVVDYEGFWLRAKSTK